MTLLDMAKKYAIIIVALGGVGVAMLGSMIIVVLFGDIPKQSTCSNTTRVAPNPMVPVAAVEPGKSGSYGGASLNATQVGNARAIFDTAAKLFPADQVGPKYIRNLLAPLPMLQIIPTGGVTPETCAEFLSAGCVALGAGSGLVSKEILASRDWRRLAARAEEFVQAVRKARA